MVTATAPAEPSANCSTFMNIHVDVDRNVMMNMFFWRNECQGQGYSRWSFSWCSRSGLHFYFMLIYFLLQHYISVGWVFKDERKNFQQIKYHRSDNNNSLNLASKKRKKRSATKWEWIKFFKRSRGESSTLKKITD